LRGQGTVLSVEAQTVGTARALAAARLLEYARLPIKRIWLANTGADCVVPPMWLRDQLRLARAGIEAIAGVVDVDSFAEHPQGVAEKFRATYLIRPDGTHSHIHGANIGFRADTYLRAGGWADLTTAEDHDLWRRVVRNGARTLSTAKIQVITSGRRHGRAAWFCERSGDARRIGERCVTLESRLRELLHSGALDLPLPGGGETALRHQRLAAFGREDLTLARMVEAHNDAIAILAEAGRVPVLYWGRACGSRVGDGGGIAAGGRGPARPRRIDSLRFQRLDCCGLLRDSHRERLLRQHARRRGRTDQRAALVSGTSGILA
jgi:hypothetical protein